MKYSTLYKGYYYSRNTVLDLYPDASAESHCLFRSASFLHISVQECLPFKYFCQSKISHFFQRGWGVLLLPSITMVFFTWRFIKMIWRLDRHFDMLWNPLAGKSMYCAVLGKSTRYSCGTLLDEVYGVAMILGLPCWDLIWVARDISSKYAAHSKAHDVM